MPSRHIAIPDVEEAVSRPVIYDILRQVFEITGLSEDTKILFAGKRGTLQTPGTSIDEISKQSNKDARFQTDKYTYVEVTENYDIGSLQETSTHDFNHTPIYIDHELRASIRPIFINSEVLVQIRYQSTSETEVRQWMSSQFVRASRGRDVNLHVVDYRYTLPEVFNEFLKTIWELREGVAPYGDSYEDYLSKSCTGALTRIGTREGVSKAFAVAHRQTRILGNFDFQGVPDKPEWDKDTATWTISFSYKFSYQKPELLHFHYPISVHNQFLPSKWIIFHEDEWKTVGYEKRHSRYLQSLQTYDTHDTVNRGRQERNMLRIPDFDDVILDKGPPAFAPAFTAMCFLEEDQQNLMSLLDLDDYTIDPDLLEYFRAEAPYMTKLHHSFIFVSLYNQSKRVSEDILEVTEGLLVRSKIKLNRRLSFRVKLAVCIDPRFILQSAYDRLSQYPTAFVKIISAMNELIGSNPEFQNLANHKKISPGDFTAIYNLLKNSHYLSHNDSPRQREFLNNGYGSESRLPDSPWLSHLTRRQIDEMLRNKPVNLASVMSAAILTKK